MSKANIVLDATKLDTFQTCEAKFNYRFNLNKVTPTKAAPLDKGTLGHTGLEYYYKALKEKVNFQEATNAAVAGMQFAANESDLASDEVGRMIEVVVEYLNFWRLRDSQLEIIDVEAPFSYILFEDDDIRIIMTGKIDLLVNDYPNYTNLVIDHKFYSRDYPVYRLKHQFQNYAIASGNNFVLVDKIGMQTSLKPEQKYKRVPLSYDPLILDEWKSDVIHTVNRYLECVAENTWTRNLTSCDKYNRLCEYYEICDSSGVEAKLYKLNANFNTAEPWDVSKALASKE